MTPEDIDKLADEYADKECAMSRHTGKKLKQLHEDKIIEFYDVFGFLIERFFIVPKEQIYMRCGVANALMEQDPARKEFYRGMSSAIVSIFGKDMFEEEWK